MAVLDMELQGILKMRTKAKVDSMADNVWVLVLRIFKVYSIPTTVTVFINAFIYIFILSPN